MNLEIFQDFWREAALFAMSWQQLSMMALAIFLMLLSLRKQFVPALMLPIAFAMLMVNMPGSNIALSAFQTAIASDNQPLIQNLASLLAIDLQSNPNAHEALLAAYDSASISKRIMLDSVVESVGYQSGILYLFYEHFIATGLAPLLLMLCVGAMTNWSYLIVRPSVMLIGMAAPFGIFICFFSVLFLSEQGILSFSVAQAAALASVGGGDGLTSLVAGRDMAYPLLPVIVISVYFYIIILPAVQPGLMRLLTSEDERSLSMGAELVDLNTHEAVHGVRLTLPVMLFVLVALFLPKTISLVGMLCLGNLLRESGLVDHLTGTLQRGFVYLLTLVLALGIGSQLQAEKILNTQMLILLVIVLLCLILSTCFGVLIAKFISALSKKPINPLLGAAGVSAPPVSAYLVNQEAKRMGLQNDLLIPAISINVAGLLASVVCIGALLTYFVN